MDYCVYHPSQSYYTECQRCRRRICEGDVRVFTEQRVVGGISTHHYNYCPVCNEEMLLRDARKFKLGMIYFTTVNLLVFAPVLVAIEGSLLLWTILIFVSFFTITVGLYKDSKARLSFEEMKKIFQG